MSWSAAQAGMLAAMGYEPVQPRGDWGAMLPPATTPHAAHGTHAAAAAPARPSPSPRCAPPMDASVDAVPAGAGQRPADVAAFASALRRAAGGGDVSALVGDLERLRRDPAAKRALWPRLRALRRLQ